MVAVVRARMLDASMQHACVQVYIVHVAYIDDRLYSYLYGCTYTWQCACAALVLHVLRCIRISINAGRLLRALDLYCFRWVGRVAFRTEF